MRPGTENDDDCEETIQTCVLSDVKVSPPRKSSPSSFPSNTTPPPPPANTPEVPDRPLSPCTTGPSGVKSRTQSRSPALKGMDVDPDASLITDFQIITDIRVSCVNIKYMYICACESILVARSYAMIVSLGLVAALNFTVGPH